jgi:hypothetical protein
VGAMAALPAAVGDWANGARLLDGLGSFHRGVTTDSSQAQQYFDQGMRLLWAFNHDESSRSFARAAQLDPKCASCYWGLALTVGPNYNLPVMAVARAKVASEALALAQKNAGRAGPVEQALIAALASRYPSDQPLDEASAAPVLTAYANAMRAVAARFPDDLDVQTLFAESMMNTNAWKLWAPDGRAASGTHEIRATLERVLLHDPLHPGANHYYVHTMEASPHPDLALGAAERLRGMMPSAGHLEHMPAHILQRLGRYEDAAQANRTGAAVDEAYFKLAQPLDYYPLIYTAHNYQFLAFSTAMEGRKAETLEAVRNARRVSADDQLRQMPAMQWQLSEEYAALLRFGLWADMLARPAPDPGMASLTGGYLYAQRCGARSDRPSRGRTEDAGRTAIADWLTAARQSRGNEHGARCPRACCAARAGPDRRGGAARQRCDGVAARRGCERRRPRLQRAERLVLSGAPHPRSATARGRPAGCGRGGVSRRSEAQPGQRLGPVQPG